MEEVSEETNAAPLPQRKWASRVRRSTTCLKTASVRQERRVVVVGDSLLRGTEGPICRPDPTRREVCCLPGAQVRDITRRLPRLVTSSDYYPLLIVQAGSDAIKKCSLRAIKREFWDLGHFVEGGPQIILSSIPISGKMSSKQVRITQELNEWLKGWCQHGNFGGFDQGMVYSAPGIMTVDGAHLSPRGKLILAQETAGLIE